MKIACKVHAGRTIFIERRYKTRRYTHLTSTIHYNYRFLLLSVILA